MRPTRRKDGRWQILIELPKTAGGKRNRKTIYGNTRKECIANALEATQKMHMGYDFTADRLTVKTYLQNWLNTYCRDLAKSTKAGYKNYIEKHIIPAIGHIKMAKLLPIHIVTFYNNEKESGYAGKTILQEHRILHKAFKDAVKNNLLHMNPISKVDPPKARAFKPNIPTPAEMALMLKAAEGTAMEMPIILAGPLGLRRSEVFARKWKDFVLTKTRTRTGQWTESGKLIVNSAVVPVSGDLDFKSTKNESSDREIAIPDKLIPCFKRHRGTDETFMCLNEKGLPLSVEGINSRFTIFLRNNDLPHYRFHDLRHYNATLMMWLDIDPKKAATRFGHSSPTTLQKTYQHLVWDMDKEVAEKINQTL